MNWWSAQYKLIRTMNDKRATAHRRIVYIYKYRMTRYINNLLYTSIIQFFCTSCCTNMAWLINLSTYVSVRLNSLSISLSLPLFSLPLSLIYILSCERICGTLFAGHGKAGNVNGDTWAVRLGGCLRVWLCVYAMYMQWCICNARWTL